MEKERRKELHQNLDILVANFIARTGNLPSRTTVLELMRWVAEWADEKQDFDNAPVRCHVCGESILVKDGTAKEIELPSGVIRLGVVCEDCNEITEEG